MWYVRAVVLAAGLILVAPLGARGADLVIWWNKGFYAQEDEAIREIIAAFEQSTGNEVELVLQPQDELQGKAEAALELGRPPDFVWGPLSFYWVAEWAYEDRLVDLEGALGANLHLFDADAIDVATLLNGRTGRRGNLWPADGQGFESCARLEEPS
jgi:multiple sugar transport system substrate-binding protein